MQGTHADVIAASYSHQPLPDVSEQPRALTHILVVLPELKRDAVYHYQPNLRPQIRSTYGLVWREHKCGVAMHTRSRSSTNQTSAGQDAVFSLTVWIQGRGFFRRRPNGFGAANKEPDMNCDAGANHLWICCQVSRELRNG